MTYIVFSELHESEGKVDRVYSCTINLKGVTKDCKLDKVKLKDTPD